jgi:hypothetical protein
VNIGLKFRQELQAAVASLSGPMGAFAQSVLANFETIYTGLQTWFEVEHNEDGTHSDLTAATATVEGLVIGGRFRLGNIVTYTAPDPNATSRLDNLTTPGIGTAGVLKIRNTASGVSLTGIDATGRKPGDMLLVINDDLMVADPTDLTIALDDSNSIQVNRFIGGSAAGAATLDGSEGMLLMYDTFTRTGLTEQTGWRIVRLP